MRILLAIVDVLREVDFSHLILLRKIAYLNGCTTNVILCYMLMQDILFGEE